MGYKLTDREKLVVARLTDEERNLPADALAKKGQQHLDIARGLDAAAEAEGRSLTTQESEAMEFHLERAEAIKASQTSRGRISQPDSPQPGNRFQREDGSGVKMLSADEKLAQDYDGPSVGHVIRGLATGNWGGVDKQMALGGGSDTAGGYYLAPHISSNVIDLARATSVITQAGARMFEMRNAEEVLVRVTSDPTVAWVGENAKFSTTEPVFGRLRFRARKMGVIVPLSRELLEDAPNAVDQVNRLLEIAMAQELDRAALLGDGDGEEPRGIFSHPNVNNQDSVGSPTYDDFLDAIQTIEDNNGAPGAYILTPNTKNTLAKLTINSEANHYAMAPDDVSRLRRYVTTKLADSQAVLGDFAQVLIGVRRGVEIVLAREGSVSGDLGFERDQYLVKVTWRGDVNIMHPEHLVTLTGIS